MDDESFGDYFCWVHAAAEERCRRRPETHLSCVRGDCMHLNENGGSCSPEGGCSHDCPHYQPCPRFAPDGPRN